MTKKQVLRTFVFIIAVFMLMVWLCDLFEYEISNMSRRYEKLKVLEKNTVDAIYVGTSGVDRYWIPSKAYEKYGMTVYPFSTEGQPAWLMKNVIDEAYKFQDPQLVILDVRPFITGDYSKHLSITDVRCRRVIDMLDFFSLNRLSAVLRTNEVMSEVDEDFNPFESLYYLSFVRYHNKWSDDSFSFNELNVERASYLGFYMGEKKTVTRKKVGSSEYTDKKIKLDKVSERYLYEILDYAKEKGINLLFADGPVQMNKTESGRRNTLWEILDSRGIPYYTLNTEEIDKEKIFSRKKKTSDFYNSSHVNYYGAEKYTDLFMEYLNDNYNFKDRRNDEEVKKDWDGVYELTTKRIETLEKKNSK